jgi:hypothetical protein
LFYITFKEIPIEEEILVFLLSVSLSNLSLFLDSLDLSYSHHFFSTCSHSFHYSCLEQCQNKCPICRREFSDYLPIFQLYAELNEYQREAVETFLTKFSNNLLISFSLLFTIIDFRERNIPDSIESQEYATLLPRLYSLLWFQNSQNQISDFFVTKFTLFIFETLQTKFPSNIIQQQIENLRKDMSLEELFIFLRRVLIFQYYVFGNTEPLSGNTFVWKDELIFENLCQRFHISIIGQIQLSKFTFVNLPTSFFDLMKSPYNYPLVDQSQNRLICLFDGVFVKETNEDTLNIPLITNHIRSNFSQLTFPIPFLFATGQNVTWVAFYNSNGPVCYSPPFYVDELGIPDVGFKRGKSIKIFNEELENVINRILTSNYKSN